MLCCVLHQIVVSVVLCGYCAVCFIGYCVVLFYVLCAILGIVLFCVVLYVSPATLRLQHVVGKRKEMVIRFPWLLLDHCLKHLIIFGVVPFF